MLNLHHKTGQTITKAAGLIIENDSMVAMRVQRRRKWLVFVPIVLLLVRIEVIQPPQQHFVDETGIQSNENTDGQETPILVWPTPLSEEQPAVYFIHVGKAGGMTLRQYLPIPLAEKKRELICWRKHDKNQTNPDHCFGSSNNSNHSVLTKKIRGHFHIGSSFFSEDEKQFLMERTDTFLYNLRNPIDRIVSAFYYHQNQSIPYPLYDCFGTIQELLQHSKTTKNDECTSLAKQVLIGNSSAGGSHFPYNYQYYESKTILQRPDHLVAGIRTEHLWQDARELDLLLGGTGQLEGYGKRYSHYQHTSEATDISAAMAAIARTPFLCCILADEIASYQSLLLRAINLSPAQKQVSLEQVLTRCGIPVDAKSQTPKTPYPLVSNPLSWREHYDPTAC